MHGFSVDASVKKADRKKKETSGLYLLIVHAYLKENGVAETPSIVQ